MTFKGYFMSSCLGGSVSAALHLMRNLVHYSSEIDLAFPGMVDLESL